MNILVTGGAGYIGSIVGSVLLEHGHSVVVVDNLTRGHRSAVAQGARFVQVDLRDVEALAEGLRGYSFDAVLHFAALAYVGESVTRPLAYYHNNVRGTLNLLGLMPQLGVGTFVFSSSCAVYGTPLQVPIQEDTPCSPVNPYGETKLATERMIQWYSRAIGMRFIALRYFNAAGATPLLGEDHRPETHLIPIVLQTALGQRPHVEVYGTDYPTPDGSCVRDYVHVLDLAEAHIAALRGDTKATEFINLGTGKGASVLEVVEAARRVTGRPIKTRAVERRPGDPPVLVASANRARQLLGVTPSRSSLENIVETAWRWHREHPSGFVD